MTDREDDERTPCPVCGGTRKWHRMSGEPCRGRDCAAEHSRCLFCDGQGFVYRGPLVAYP